MLNLKRADFWFNTALLLIGVSVVCYGLYYGLFAGRRPGPGLFPFLAGLLMTLASLAGFGSVVSAPEAAEEPPSRGLIIRMAVFVAAIVGLLAIAEPLGLLLAVFMMMVAVGVTCSDWPLNPRFLVRIVFVSAAFSLVCHLFFKLALRIPVLEGPFDALF